LSDHSSIGIKCSGVCLSNNSAMHNDTKGAPSGEASVKQLRWDHPNLPLYRDTTELYLYNIYQDLLKQALDDSVTTHVIDNYYSKIVESLNASANIAVPACRRNVYKFWWDHSLDELKQKSISPVTFGDAWVGPVPDRYLTAIGKTKPHTVMRFATNQSKRKNFILTSCTRPCSKTR